MLESDMSSAAEKAVEAIELLPEEMREPAAAYLLSQAKKFRALKTAIDEGMADVEAGRVVPWDLEDFLEQARAHAQR
jgi:predicted transcriptional regulator